MMLNGLSLRITAPIVLLSMLAVGLTAFLNFGKFERSFDDIERSRIDFVLADLRNNLETGIDLGLPLKDLANAQAALNFQAAADHEISAIYLIDMNGNIVFQTGTRAPAAGLPPAWLGAAEPTWRLLAADTQIVGTRLTSAIGADAGCLILRYSRRHRDQVLKSVAADLLLLSMIILVLTGSAALLLISRIVRDTNRCLQHYAEKLSPP